MIVGQAPENVLSGRGCVVQTPNCWLHQAYPDPRDAAPVGATNT